ncbi:MAG: single-stranded DNA-binding protein [Candidatus Levyibacteriota bacterium]
MARSLNKVQLIGNLTRDPELRYTPNGRGVCTFSVATNRSWTTESGEKREEVDFHRIVAWGKLAELCSQFLTKGRKVYVEGRLATRNWTGQDGTQKSTTEIVIDDMILLDNRGGASQQSGHSEESGNQEVAQGDAEEEVKKPSVTRSTPKPVEKAEETAGSGDEEVDPGDIPF